MFKACTCDINHVNVKRKGCVISINLRYKGEKQDCTFWLSGGVYGYNLKSRNKEKGLLKRLLIEEL